MPSYTPNLGLYLPNKVDDLSIIDTLVDNFEKIDDASLKGGYGIVNLKSYLPANKTDNTDVTQAFVDAFNEMETENLGVLIVPRGVYSVSAYITIPSNTTIIMHTDTTIRRLGNHGFFINFERNQNTSNMKGNWNITIIGGTLDQRGRTGGIQNQNNMTGWMNGRNLKILGVRFLDSYGSHCIDLVGMKGVEIAYCTFEGYDWDKTLASGRRYYAESIQVDLAYGGALPTNTNESSFDGTVTEDVTVHHNTWKRSSANQWSCGRGIGEHSFRTESGGSQGVIVTNNVFQDVLDVCMYSYGFTNSVFSNNLVKNCGGALRVRTNQDSGDFTGAPSDMFRTMANANTITGIRQHTYTTTSNTTVNTSSGYAFYVDGYSDDDGRVYEINISGNNISDVDNEAISCTYARRLVISGNSIKESVLTGSNNIILTSCNGFVITGNTFYSSKYHNIGIYDCEDGTIYANKGYGTKKSGIHITSSSDRVVVTSNHLEKTNSDGGAYSGIAITASSADITVAMNNICNQATGSTNAIYSTSTSANNHIWGNKIGGNGTANVVSLGGTGNVTTATNVST